MGYLQAAMELLKEGGYPVDPIDEKHNTHTKRILACLQWYENVPNRRECISNEMLDKFTMQQKQAPPHSLEDCFQDWLALGHYTGFRRSEWAQTQKLSYEHNYNDTHLPRQAMLDDDCTFFDNVGRLLNKRSDNEDKVHNGGH